MAAMAIPLRTHARNRSERRAEAALALIDRLETVAELLKAEPVNPRIGLALVLLGNAADDAAKLGGR
jgi:hypothetical protein